MREPDKNRFLNAVKHIESVEISFQENDPDTTIVNKIMGRQFPLSLHAFDLPMPDYIELGRRMGNDMIFFSHVWRLGRKEKTDAQGRIHYVDGTMKTRASLKDIWYPDMDFLKRRLEEMLDLVDNTGFGVICRVQSAPFMAATAIGYQDYWLNTATDPAFIHNFTKTVQEWCLREQELYMKYPVDVIMLASAFVTKTGAMCSPGMLEEFETSYLRQQMQMAKAGGKVVYFHIDGNVTRMIPGFIEMGVDVLNPLESCDGAQDIYQIKKMYGDQISLHGNIDINGVLLNGSAEEIRRDVNEHIEKLAIGGGYIVGSSHDLHQLIPVESFYAMRDAVHEYRFVRK